MMGRVSEFAIDLHNVAKTYAGGVTALRDVVMQVRAGEISTVQGGATRIPAVLPFTRTSAVATTSPRSRRTR